MRASIARLVMVLVLSSMLGSSIAPRRVCIGMPFGHGSVVCCKIVNGQLICRGRFF